MALFSGRKVRLLLGILVLMLLATGVGAWLQRERLLTWYDLRGLAKAEEKDRDWWANRVAAHGESVVPGLLQCLTRDDERTCANARSALEQMCSRFPQDDARWGRLVDAFPRLSQPGQCCVLSLAANWMHSHAHTSAAFVLSLMNAASQVDDSAVHALALDIVDLLVSGQPNNETNTVCRALARCCFHDSDARNRERAVHFGLYPRLNLLADVAPLLCDPSADVRRAVVLAVGNSRRTISDERLALALHDPDGEVRRLCEKALLGRGLTRRHVHLARLITDSRPATRLQVLSYLREDSDLDLAVWLRLLTQDPAEAVRLAAVRAAAEQAVGDLNERLQQMAAGDPSPTVSRWARYYLGCLRQRQASNVAP